MSHLHLEAAELGSQCLLPPFDPNLSLRIKEQASSLRWLGLVSGRSEGSGHCVEGAVLKCSQYVQFSVGDLAYFWRAD